MKQLEKAPIWVQLAWASVPTRQIALSIIVSCVVFTLYCIPWVKFSANPLVAKLFLINDWWWSAPMVPLIAWYWISLKWVDKHDGWESN